MDRKSCGVIHRYPGSPTNHADSGRLGDTVPRLASAMHTVATAATASPAREREAALLAQCVATATGQARADSVGLASLHGLAASLLQARLPAAAIALRASADALLSAAGHTPLSLTELREQGWIVDLPRFRRQLFQTLGL